MNRKSVPIRLLSAVAVVVAIAGAAVFLSARQSTVSEEPATGRREATFKVARRDFVRAIRLSGTVEAVESTTIAAPRLAGPNSNSLVITTLVRPGSTVAPGDLIVEFDRQDQIKNSLDRRAELQDLEQQIAKREAQERAARAHDDSEMTLAESAIGRAQLEMGKNELLPKINVEKNKLALEQAEATLKQLKATYELKRRAAEADIRILQIRRDRAANAERAGRRQRRADVDSRADCRHGRREDDLEGQQHGGGAGRRGGACRRADRRHRESERDAGAGARQPGGRQRAAASGSPSASASTRIPALFVRRPGRRRFRRSASRRCSRPRSARSSSSSTSTGSHPNLMPDLSASLDVTLGSHAERDRHPARRAATGWRTRRSSASSAATSFEERPVTVAALNAHEAMDRSGARRRRRHRAQCPDSARR